MRIREKAKNIKRIELIRNQNKNLKETINELDARDDGKNDGWKDQR